NMPTGSEQTARTGVDGRFTLETTLVDPTDHPQTWEFVVLDERYSTALQPGSAFRQSTTTEHVLVIADRQPLAGTVLDTAGNTLAGATVTADVGHEIRSRFSELLEDARIPLWSTTSDVNGMFEIPDAPRLENCKLVTVCPGFAKDIRPLPDGPTSNLDIILGAVEDGLTQLDGIVLDGVGQPVAGARVALEYSNGTTDADGRFSLRLFGDGKRGVLMAIKAGSLPARLERSGVSNLTHGAWPDPLVLTLGGSPLSIRGRVLDSAGNPVEKAQVWTTDVTHFGAIESDFGPMITVAADVESLLSVTEDGERRVWTDSDGAFELGGLLDKDYRVSVHDTKNVSFVRTDPVRAGTARLVVEMPEEERIPRVGGRVVHSDGEPAAGVSVSLCQMLSETPGFKDRISTSPVTTDEEGKFVLRDVPSTMTHADLFGPGLDFGDNRQPIPEGANFENLELVTRRSCRARIELGDPEKADFFRLLDADGEESLVTIYSGDSASASPLGILLEGRSQVFRASESTSTLILFKGHEEVERVPLQLQADRLTELQL
ncbi:MAG: hypothetical protein ACI8QZ_003872, partial [Chlamydiales bacterium]